MRSYFYHLAVAFDQLFNALLAGAADETLSSRAYRGANLTESPKKKWVVLHKLINGLFFWEKDHCKKSYDSEVLRRQYPKAFQDIK
ncbi:DNA helicase UvrD [Pasteurella multocida subsp. multocida]|uniref:DNA helicase UvrD n=1 Tax=Pasteurella multocida TaxID=747 RepID=A0A9X3UPV0_PASMD|nr:DNA helicase UvrD [Pasteurella multocida]MBF6980010.1 DNA helicase UvrD [Pasteurella multocida]MBF6983327.1 DNA helicase UvrD [Pasteurella multocida]MDA5609692.1 DNA helicase UvrD [Pasteurella multocida]MDA5612416.1 DNA helicase UvrD [Pasteurella multocida]MDA5617586.1 DNA helicase UvrD [Pasteurella multocida subsp. multocida]